MREGQLFALRIVCAGDVVPLLPYDVPFYDTVHAVAPRLLLDPTSKDPLESLELQKDAPQVTGGALAAGRGDGRNGGLDAIEACVPARKHAAGVLQTLHP